MIRSILNASHLGRWLVALACGGLSLGGLAETSPTPSASAASSPIPIPIESFMRLPAIESVAVSPSGTQLAMTTASANGRLQLVVVRLDPIGKPKVVATFGDGDVFGVRWINETRLVFHAANLDKQEREAEGYGLYAVNADGSGWRQLIADFFDVEHSNTHIIQHLLPANWRLLDTVDDGSADIIVGDYRFDGRGNVQAIYAWRLDTSTGTRRSSSEGAPDHAMDWVFDDHSEARVVATLEGPFNRIYLREGTSTKWRLLAEVDRRHGRDFDPAYVDPDNMLHVISRTAGRDALALYRWDIATGAIESEPLVGIKGFDLHADDLQTEWGTHRLLGVHYRMQQPGTYWFDKDLRRVQKSVDSALPADRVNRLYCGRCSTTRYFVVGSRSDRNPGEFFLLDRETMKLEQIGAARPWIDEATQGHRTFEMIKSRDGESLPVYVTRPNQAAATARLPTIVLVHGGPWVRGSDLMWSADAQLLASRGYLVIEPESRGSIGYGYEHFAAGLKNWGRAMQDDLADAAAWAVDKGWADKGKICIMGASYGGYAALMGPIRNPGVYRCAISYAGVTDISLMYSLEVSDMSDVAKQFDMPYLIGDPVADKQVLDQVSPLKQVARIGVPVLLAHGRLDRRVPLEHAERFRAAAEQAGVKVEWLLYPDEAHGFRKTADAVDYWQHVERFLDRSMAAPPAK